MLPSIEALDAPDNTEYGSVEQHDYHTWVGEAAQVQSGAVRCKG